MHVAKGKLLFFFVFLCFCCNVFGASKRIHTYTYAVLCKIKATMNTQNKKCLGCAAKNENNFMDIVSKYEMKI